MDCFSGILDIDQAENLSDDQRYIKRWRGIASKFKGKLINMIKDAASKFDDYSISPKVRQILFHWSYELVKSDLL